MWPYYHLDLESAGDSTRVWVETEDYGIRVESRTHLRDVWMDIRLCDWAPKYCTKFPYKDYFCTA
jgi:hypothetical protein